MQNIIPDHRPGRLRIMILTFGYLHGAPPPMTVTLDLREHFRDPHVSPTLRCMTAADQQVRTTVLTTPGVGALIDATAAMVLAYLAGTSAEPVTVAIGCAGGRHRAPVVGMDLARVLTGKKAAALALTHRDLHKEVVRRPTRPEM